MEKKPKKILFFRTDRIGDFLVSLPSLEALKQRFPQSHITVILNPLVQALVKGHTTIDTSILFSTTEKPSLWAWLRLYLQLRKKSYDMAFVSNPHKYFHLITWLLRIPVRVGYDRKWECFLTHRVDREEKGEGVAEDTSGLLASQWPEQYPPLFLQKHQLWNNFLLIKTLCKAIHFPPRTSLPVNLQDHAQLNTLLKDQDIDLNKPFMVIAPFTTHPGKAWPLNCFLTLAHKFSESHHYNVVFIGGAGDAKNLLERSFPFAALRVRMTALNLCGKLSLRHVAALLQQAKLLISNDSGPVHIAACVQTPTLVLYGQQDKGSSPERWGAHWNGGTSHRVIVKEFISEITVDEVWNIANEQLF